MKGCICPRLFHLECCSNKELLHSSFPGTSWPHSWWSRIRAPPCGSGSALLSTCSFPFPQLPLHWAYAPLPTSDTSFCRNPVICNYVGKAITENRVFQWGQGLALPKYSGYSHYPQLQSGVSPAAGHGGELEAQTKTEGLTWKKKPPQIITELMISCRSHQRSISDWIFSLASWCLWTITLKWNYTCMYRTEREIKLILCFTWNYSMPGSEAGNVRDHRVSVLRISWNYHIMKTRTVFSLASNPKYRWSGTWGVLPLKLSLSKLEKMPHSFDPHMLRIHEKDQTTYFKIWQDSLSGCNAEFEFSHLFNPE